MQNNRKENIFLYFFICFVYLLILTSTWFLQIFIWNFVLSQYLNCKVYQTIIQLYFLSLHSFLSCFDFTFCLINLTIFHVQSIASQLCNQALVLMKSPLELMWYLPEDLIAMVGSLNPLLLVWRERTTFFKNMNFKPQQSHRDPETQVQFMVLAISCNFS